MPRNNSPPKSAFRQVNPNSGLIQRTPALFGPLMPRAPAPPVVPQTIPVEHKTGGILDSMKQGFGWGIGTSIARNMFTPTVSPIVPPASSSTASVPTNTVQELLNQPAYNQCRKEGGDHEACKQFIS
jgi:hypothetical protein